ncbi:MAG: hypothetical protein KDD44_08650 [Bdellovibrionales bacterium]|nr:hypothetical protein [Bdellovibrionales bacterium]
MNNKYFSARSSSVALYALLSAIIAVCGILGCDKKQPATGDQAPQKMQGHDMNSDAAGDAAAPNHGGADMGSGAGMGGNSEMGSDGDMGSNSGDVMSDETYPTEAEPEMGGEPSNDEEYQ